MRAYLPLIGIGVAAGFLSALFGVGGGVLIVPALVSLRGFGVRQATATSLAAIAFTAVVGSIRYAISGDVHVLDAVLIGVPALLGVTLGTTLQRRLPAARLQLGFAIFAAATGLKLATGVGSFQARATTVSAGHLLLIGALGVLAGLLSGLFGVGGGIVFVPALTIGVGLSQLEAEATSLLAMIPVVALGATRQWRAGLVDVRTAVAVGAASVPGVLVGVQVATAVSDDTLKVAFGIFLCVIAAQMAWKSLRPQERTASVPAASTR